MLRPYDKMLALELARRLHPFLNHGGGLSQPLAAQLVIFHARHLDVDVDAVVQWAGDVLLILGHRTRRASAGFDRVTVEAARAGVQCNTMAGGTREKRSDQIVFNFGFHII